MSSTIIQIQGIRIHFTSGLEPLNEFARSHFADGVQATDVASLQAREERNGEADIEARLEWIEGIAPRPNYQTISLGMARPDRDIEIGDREMAWSRIDDFLPLKLRFLLDGNRLRLEGRHFFSLSPAPVRDRLRKALYRGRLSTLRGKRFSTILYYMVYYPSFCWLERRGLFPLHASAVDLGGTGAVFCGLPGCGKSTLSLALLSLPKARLLSDNILFFSTDRVFRCPEPVLVDDVSVRLIGQTDKLLYPLGRRHVYERGWYHVNPGRVAEETIPRLFFFVRLAKESSVRPLSPEETYRRFTSANWIAQELRRYFVYRSVLGLLSTSSHQQTKSEESALQALLKQGRSYELTVGWGNELQKTRAHVENLLTSLPL